jgi:hypothetical protein
LVRNLSSVVRWSRPEEQSDGGCRPSCDLQRRKHKVSKKESQQNGKPKINLLPKIKEQESGQGDQHQAPEDENQECEA